MTVLGAHVALVVVGVVVVVIDKSTPSVTQPRLFPGISLAHQSVGGAFFPPFQFGIEQRHTLTLIGFPLPPLGWSSTQETESACSPHLQF